MNEIVLFSGIYLLGVIISAFSQVLLKKSANNADNCSFIKQYLNVRVVSAYVIFVAATLLSIFAYKVIPLTLGAILGTLEYGLVAILSHFLLKEDLHKKQILGLIIIIAGIIVYSI
jgi:drug/metabolite transporter (DMT)-like permease